MGRLPKLKIVETPAESSIQARNSGYPSLVGELWSAKKRQLHSLHYAVTYSGSFKPELPDFCIRRYSNKGDIVLDPFSGRGTTALQANLLGRVAWASDSNPLSVKITNAKLSPVGLDELLFKLPSINLNRPIEMSGYQEIFSPFYHPDTYRELVNLKKYLSSSDDVSASFIELVAMSRLHGHSSSYLSVYSFPQLSLSPDNQRLFNLKRSQKAEYRAVAPRLIKQAALSMRDGFSSEFFDLSSENIVERSNAENLNWAASDAVDLIVTSPPGLEKIDYFTENWLSYWFTGVSAQKYKEITSSFGSVPEWREFISGFLMESLRVLKKHGHAVVEVPLSSNSELNAVLEEELLKLVKEVSYKNKRFSIEEVLINQHKTSKLTKSFKDYNQEDLLSEDVSKVNSKNASNKLIVLRCEALRTRPR